MKRFFIACIGFYQKFLSLDTGIPRKIGLTHRNTCGFYPTCSEYTKQAIEKYGVWKGIKMGIRRIGRCHPWQHDLYDPVK